MRRAVFLDRDGVINRAVVKDGKPYPPASVAEFVLLPGVKDAIKKLRNAGFLVIVVTNQPDVATGVQQRSVVEAMHQMLIDADLCDDIKVCYHTDADHCKCRKPCPGMLQEAAREWHIDMSQSYMVGDRWRDIAAGKAAGCHTFFIDYQYAEHTDNPDAVVTSLQEASMQILEG